jgi:hypothetical protein
VRQQDVGAAVVDVELRVGRVLGGRIDDEALGRGGGGLRTIGIG